MALRICGISFFVVMFFFFVSHVFPANDRHLHSDPAKVPLHFCYTAILCFLIDSVKFVFSLRIREGLCVSV